MTPAKAAPMREDVTQAEALSRCAEQFEYYAKSHRAKGTPDADAKAIVNDGMVAMCRAALAAMREGVDRGMVERAKTALMWAIAEIEDRTIYRDNAVWSAADQRRNALDEAHATLIALDTEQPR